MEIVLATGNIAKTMGRADRMSFPGATDTAQISAWSVTGGRIAGGGVMARSPASTGNRQHTGNPGRGDPDR